MAETPKTETVKEEAGLYAKKVILMKKGFTPEDVSRVNSVVDADLLLNFARENEKAEADKAKINAPESSVKKNNAPIGFPAPTKPQIPPVDNPDPRLNQAPPISSDVPYAVEELFDPCQTDTSRLNKDSSFGTPEFVDSIRILKVYDDKSPNGRIF
jgi:hypothetical protein